MYNYEIFPAMRSVSLLRQFELFTLLQ